MAPTANISPVGKKAHIPTPIIVAPLPIINPAATAPAPGGAPAPDPAAAHKFSWNEEQERAKKYVVQAKEFDDNKPNQYDEDRDYKHLTI